MSDDALIGRQIATFRIERLLGRGGMGRVYYGHDLTLLRPVAIKLIDTAYQSNPTAATRFINEARAVATWNHEHIPQVYYADDEDGLYYFVMEFIDGQDLGAILVPRAASGERLPHAEVLRIGRALASALDYAHAKGVIHRDVKPGNIMLEQSGRILLMDFGLALDTRQGTRGEVFGSVQYMAPEQARSSAAAVPQSDIYALGVLLYELLTGVVPFNDPSPTSVAIQHLTAPPPLPRTINPALNEATEQVLLMALSKAPADRYQTASALLDALEQALLIPARPELPPAALPRRAPGTRPLTLVSPAAAPPRDPLIGTQLGAYLVETLVGRGGMARIYRGLDTRLERPVAIKIIDTPFQRDADYTLRFRREAQAVAQLEHPTIVRLYDYGDVNGLLFMVMEFVAGETLQALITRSSAAQELMPLAQVAGIVRAVCTALDVAHRKGIIHRDVKPGNILINEAGHAILADFGLALLTSEGTRGEVFGTPHYIAPEQAMSSAGAVPQSDLYAVGVILYELVTGLLPFDSADPLEIALLHMTEPVRPVRELRPEVPPALETVIIRALAKEPRQRFETGAALATALEQAVLPLLPDAPPASPRIIAQPDRRQPEQRPASVAGPPQQSHAAQLQAVREPQRLPHQDQADAISLAHDPAGSSGQPGPRSHALPERRAAPPALSLEQRLRRLPRPLLLGLGALAVIVAILLVSRSVSDQPPDGNPGGAGGMTSYTLRIVKDDDAAMTLTNLSSDPFPLGPLQLGEGQQAIQGTAWDVATLEQNACVVVEKAKKNDEDDEDDEDTSKEREGCARSRATLKSANGALFWTTTFNVYYDGTVLATCVKDRKSCQFAIAVERE